MLARGPRRRRPLMRAAVVGGAGYMAGKKVAAGREAEADQNARIDQLEQQQYAAPPAAPAPPAPPAPPPAPPAAAGDDTVAQLKQLADLHSAGALNDAEFEAAKAKLLGT
jgi:hypothetical protein